MYLPRSPLYSAAFLVLLALPSGRAFAQKKPPAPDSGYIPVVAPEGKKKKKSDDFTQALPPSPEPPAAVTAETAHLVFEVTPLSSKGLLSQQTRDALKGLLKSKRGTIVKLRAFVAGSGDLRRIGDILGETFQEKHVALPALSVAQVGALPLEGAQVVIESIEEEHKVVNPNGVAFVAGQPAASVPESLEKLKRVLASAGMQPDDALSVTCFISSLDDQRNTHKLMAASFPAAALDYVQMQRGPVNPASDCEAVARLGPASPATSAPNSQAVFVRSAEVVITGTQLAFGNQDSDFKLAFERLEKTLAESKTDLAHLARAHLYTTGNALDTRLLAIETAQTGAAHAPANTIAPFESLPSLDAVFGIDVIAVPHNP
jgi:enamine deaminase RidA (YjgF/YER057c/UK114 family)